MGLNPTHIAPRKSFGRRVPVEQAPVAPQAPARIAPVAPAPAEPPAQNWLSAVAGLPPPAAKPVLKSDQSMEMAQPEEVRLDTSRVIAKSFGLMSRNGVTFTALVAAAAAPNRLLYHLTGSDALLAAGMPLTTALGCFVLYAAVFHGAIGGLKGETISLDGCLRAGLRGFKSAYGSIALTVLSVWLLLIMPCIGLATGWAVAAPAALAEGLSLRAALARSVGLTAPHRPQVRALVLLLAALALSRGLMMMPIWGVPAAGLAAFVVGNWLFPLLLTAFAAASGAVLYRELAPLSDAPPAQS